MQDTIPESQKQIHRMHSSGNIINQAIQVQIQKFQNQLKDKKQGYISSEDLNNQIRSIPNQINQLQKQLSSSDRNRAAGVFRYFHWLRCSD